MNNRTIRLSADTSSLTDTPCKTAEDRKIGREEDMKSPVTAMPKLRRLLPPAAGIGLSSYGKWHAGHKKIPPL